ncbi:zinc finger C2H2-type/integrase DNA-binding domain-containing protein, partial [Tanacetum coccineum]
SGVNSNVVENGDDLTKYLKGRSVTERRGRRSLKMDDSDEDDEDLLEACNGVGDHEPIVANSDEKPLVVITSVKALNRRADDEALGGHRSSHNKAANKIISDDHFVGENVEKEAEFAGDVINISKSAVGHVHQCKICDKVFPTGQALGGHKRCHWTGYCEAAQAHVQAQAQAISSQITSTGEAASTGSY